MARAYQGWTSSRRLVASAALLQDGCNRTRVDELDVLHDVEWEGISCDDVLGDRKSVWLEVEEPEIDRAEVRRVIVGQECANRHGQTDTADGSVGASPSRHHSVVHLEAGDIRATKHEDLVRLRMGREPVTGRRQVRGVGGRAGSPGAVLIRDL